MPSVEEELAAWLNDRLPWVKNLAATIMAHGVADQAAVQALATQLVAKTPSPAVKAFAAADFPSTVSTGATVELLGIQDLENVNALEKGSSLTFGQSGLTVIYGDNGSGKSGFARLVKELVGARHHQPILPNAFDPIASKAQSATVIYRVNGAERSLAWPAKQDTELTQVHFYDEACGDHYLVNDTELSYRPSALAFLDDLIEATDRLRVAIDAQLARHNAPSYQVVGLNSGTSSSNFCANFSADVTDSEIDAAVELPEDAESSLARLIQEESRLQTTSPVKEQNRLNNVARALDRVADHLDLFESALGPTAAAALDDGIETARSLRAAADLASKESFTDEPLDGVGSETWRVLWDAAEKYSVGEAYHEHEFPFVESGARCPLCQQPLQPDGAQRLARFKAFVHEQTATRARAAEIAADQGLSAFKAFEVMNVEITTSLITIEGDDRDLATTLRSAFERASNAKTRISERLRKESTEPALDLQLPDTGALRSRAKTLREKASAIDPTQFAEQLKAATSAKHDLADRIELAKHAPALKTEAARLRTVRDITAIKNGISTQPITKQSTALTRIHVNERVNDRFARETDRLGLEHVKLDDKGGGKGKLRHKPALLGASLMTKSVRDVLSEGEQTALGLAGLLTEVNFDASKSALVLDDPITSLDHGRREKVARRIAALAGERQVIVFTHDLTFLGDLIRAADEEDVALAERSITKDGKGIPGHVLETHPWKAKDAKKRLGDLREGLARLRKEQVDLPPEEHGRRVQLWAGMLSETWERVVRNDVVGKVVDRGTTEVRPKMVKLLARITDDDNADFQSGYSQVSKWAPRHDKSEEVNFVAPSCDELEAELKRLEDWHKRIVTYAQ
ncbi:AAA family ATPase [Leifsonia sp. 1010]|uniref:AAA family ATPase n=1 Tax=Leifsonia sp. 1010 TaxID=2817769 RepID=UPI0028593D54|nr:AAA family ATPase [Leifsonia sp. 1010]MDR6613809.1 energy-coupling factor transporter ATP-binding protein EcfA2 [Leifsonia sp. 1010]